MLPSHWAHRQWLLIWRRFVRISPRAQADRPGNICLGRDRPLGREPMAETVRHAIFDQLAGLEQFSCVHNLKS